MKSDLEIHERAKEYYRGVRGYHQIVEDQPHETFVVPPELLLRFVDARNLVIDVAGGSGINAQILGLSASKYVCTDISFQGLSIAAGKQRGMCVQVNVGQLPIKTAVANSVLCSWSLEHMTDPGTVFDEMVRIVKPGGRILIWGPNWDNVFRKDFPQFAHKTRTFVRRVRRHIFFRMIKNEFLPFHYNPYVNVDVAAFADPDRFISGDTDAVHCVLCQETVKVFQQRGLRVVHTSDFSEMGKHLRNDSVSIMIRRILEPFLPILRRIPLLRWFVIRFPIVLEKSA